MSSVFTPNCKDCPRLAEFLATQKEKFPDYYCKPVAAFGDPKAKFLIVGLAPGLHGANATARPFTGDHAGILLYQTLYQFGFSSHAESVSKDDDLRLINTRITNAVKCVPPQNKPTPAEIKTCNRYLLQELNDFTQDGVVLALGRIAHEAVIRALALRQKDYPFAHAAEHQLPDFELIDSYHCSRYNTQTKRLTSEQFAAVFATIRTKLQA
ncbi:MAG: uracil-DNA glycosylase [Gammaproteobacteria bacterium]|nr:uracil-DNA glycosylase [Gammaproteobacteria bacterium]